MKSLISRHFPMTMLCLAVAWSCSDDDGAPQKAVGAATGSGGGGGSAAVAAGAGSGGTGTSATGGSSSGEMGGSNGLAQPGTNSNSGAAQGGSAGSANMAGAGGSAGAPPETDAGPAAADSGVAAALVTYTKDIQPILVANCSPCHSTDRDGGHNAATSFADAVRVSADIVREIRSGGMPESGNGNQGCNRGDPGDPGCVSVADFDLIQRWIADGTPQ